MKQEVRIVIDLSIELDCKYSDSEVRQIVKRGALQAFRNNNRTLNALKFAEEAAIYANDDIKWTHIYREKK